MTYHFYCESDLEMHLQLRSLLSSRCIPDGSSFYFFQVSDGSIVIKQQDFLKEVWLHPPDRPPDVVYMNLFFLHLRNKAPQAPYPTPNYHDRRNL